MAENEEILKLKKKLLRKYPTFGSTINTVEFKAVGQLSGISTACTDGNTIYFNKNFMRGLDEEQRLFILAHEVGHIALKHCERGKDKDPMVFNYAADAVLNQFLFRDGLKKVDGVIDIPEAINYSVDELYEKLLNEKQKQMQGGGQGQQNNQSKSQQIGQSQQDESGQNGKGQQNNNQLGNLQNEQESKQNQQDNTQNGQGSGQNEQNQQDNSQNEENSQQNQGNQQNNSNQQVGEQSSHSKGQGDSLSSKYGIDWSNTKDEQKVGHDDHAMWKDLQNEKEAEQKEKEKSKQAQNPQEQNGKGENKGGEFNDLDKDNIDEREVFKENEKEKVRRAEEIMSEVNSQRRGMEKISQLGGFDNVGEAKKSVVNWKKILRQELEKEDEAWGYKFSDRGNGYKARLQDVEYEEQPDTEIILDVSGSISQELLLNFLRQMKLLLKNSDIKVGTFSYDFNGWHEIKKTKDIDEFAKCMRLGGGTNFDAASRAFSKDPRVNKIVFTDGQDGGNAGIKEPRKDIIWITFDNPHFKPDYGRVLYVPPEAIMGNQKLLQDDRQR